MVTEARKCGVKAVIVPYGNRQEAASVSGIKICPVKSLPDTIRFLEGRLNLEEQEKEKAGTAVVSSIAVNGTGTDGKGVSESGIDFSDVKGQDELIEAIVLGAAGGHNILMLGEPGCGKR